MSSRRKEDFGSHIMSKEIRCYRAARTTGYTARISTEPSNLLLYQALEPSTI